MTRCRLMLSALAIAAPGAAWWLLSDGLSAEERRLVGTWRGPRNDRVGTAVWRFYPDRMVICGRLLDNEGRVVNWDEWPGPWSIRDGQILLDHEPSAVRRTLGPVLRAVGLALAGVTSLRLEALTDEQLEYTTYATRSVWTRVRDDGAPGP